LINAVKVKVPVGKIKALSEHQKVKYVQTSFDDSEPPADSNSNNDPIVARTALSSDPYSISSSYTYIGLLDTGVRQSHVMFNSPDYLSLVYDCTTNPCTVSSGFDTCWNHGTSSAGIIVGNNRLGNRFEGMTKIILDSFNIYTCATLDVSATVRAVETSLSILDRVLVAEIQASEGLNGAIVTAFENAYTTGAVVIAANGNFGPSASTVRSPAIGRKVLGIGAYDINTGALQSYSGRGPTTDFRFKPDVIMPSHTETASNVNDNAQQVFTGTSGATPYGAGVAALYLNYFKYIGLSTEPGHVYAAIIASAANAYGSYDNDVGAGKVSMVLNGNFWIGRTTVTTGSTSEVTFPVPAYSTRPLRAAIWWPEYGAAHNDVDLKMFDEVGTQVAYSASVSSVWERAQVTPSYSSVARTWKITINGYSIPTSPQTVYYYISN